MWRAWMIGLAGVVWLGATQPALPAEPPLVEKYLHEGRLAEGEKALLAELRQNPKDDQARFGLGALQFFRVVEHLGQSLHRYGVRNLGRDVGIPLLRMPVPPNSDPETLTYAAARKILEELIDDLKKAEATLAEVRDDAVKLPLRMAQVRLDLTGDGNAGDPLGAILVRYLGGEGNVPKGQELLVAFDRGDVAWLRGYCHLLMALSEFALAHDGQELFNCTAHVFFAKVETPYAFLTGRGQNGRGNFSEDISDVIAFIHLMRLPVKEPERMKTALVHLESMLALSGESWKFILAEKDDDHEWVPNANQTSVIGVPVQQEMIDSWLEFVKESEALLAGKRLVPFWRSGEQRGVNVRRVFTEPRTFDLVLWVQGTAATPYLEEGAMTNRGVWERLLRVFRGEFIGFAFWFN